MNTLNQKKGASKVESFSLKIVEIWEMRVCKTYAVPKNTWNFLSPTVFSISFCFPTTFFMPLFQYMVYHQFSHYILIINDSGTSWAIHRPYTTQLHISQNVLQIEAHLQMSNLGCTEICKCCLRSQKDPLLSYV